MSFFRKVAGAFVEIDDTATPQQKERTARGASQAQSDGAAPPLENLSGDAAALLAQLEAAVPSDPGGAVRGSAPQTGEGGPLAAGFETLTCVQMTADDVFREAGVADSASSSQRLLKLLAGLTMFPREQQLAMVRAMDTADETWNEAEVVADARARQEALRTHMQRITQERAAQSQALAAEMERTRQTGASVLAEIDRRIQDLYKRREQEVATTSEMVARLQAAAEALQQQEEQSRRGIAKVGETLGSLVSFFETGATRQG